jgi:C-terminal processing protease CtpA/Prc
MDGEPVNPEGWLKVRCDEESDSMRKKGDRYRWWRASVAAVGLFRPVRSAVDDTYRQIRLLVDILQLVREQYVEEVDQKKTLVYGAAAGMARDVGSVQPVHGAGRPQRNENRNPRGSLAGWGIRLGLRDGWLTVITPMPETPRVPVGHFAGGQNR